LVPRRHTPCSHASVSKIRLRRAIIIDSLATDLRRFAEEVSLRQIGVFFSKLIGASSSSPLVRREAREVQVNIYEQEGRLMSVDMIPVS
jgi:hypothetical protein